MEGKIGNITYFGNVSTTMLASFWATLEPNNVTICVAVITGAVSLTIGVVAFISHKTKIKANKRLTALSETQTKLAELEIEIASTRLQRERMDWELTKKCMNVMMPDISKASENEKPIKPE
jgi:NAD/NADP transhydrogenase beta subunit